MKVAIFTGSRDLPYRLNIRLAIEGCVSESRHIYVGCCRTGLDAAVRDLSREMCPLGISVFRARWEAHGRKAGPLRNQQMVDAARMESDVIVYAWPLGESRGTRDCMRRAKAAGFEVRVMTEEHGG
ncbi:MAG: hypothetical protein AAGE52_01475 [Myxococcota bacterium]